MSDFFKSFGHAFASPQQQQRHQQPQQQPHGANHGQYAHQHNNGYPGNAAQQQQHSQSHPSPFDSHRSHARPAGSPQPASASYSYSPAPSPMRPPAGSGAPSSSYSSSAAPPSAAGHAAGQQSAASPAEPTLDHLRSEHARVEHSVSVCEMRLKHCLDSEDERSSGEAARVLAIEKKALRELTASLSLREKREGAEQRVRGVINSKFDSERSLIAERRRQIETAKQRLRHAFALPVQAASHAAAAASSHGVPLLGTHFSPDVPLQSDRASAYTTAGRSPSPLPAHASGAGSRSSPSPPPASPHPDCSLFDLLPRLRLDVGKAQVALEHQNLRVDSIELASCVQQAHAAATTSGGPGGPGGPAASSSSSSDALLSPSVALSSFFKSSRKEVVRALLAALAEVDGLTTHIKQAEAFMAYLQMQQPEAHAGQHEQQHPAAAAADAMQY